MQVALRPFSIVATLSPSLEKSADTVWTAPVVSFFATSCLWIRPLSVSHIISIVSIVLISSIMHFIRVISAGADLALSFKCGPQLHPGSARCLQSLYLHVPSSCCVFPGTYAAVRLHLPSSTSKEVNPGVSNIIVPRSSSIDRKKLGVSREYAFRAGIFRLYLPVSALRIAVSVCSVSSTLPTPDGPASAVVFSFYHVGCSSSKPVLVHAVYDIRQDKAARMSLVRISMLFSSLLFRSPCFF